MLDVRVEPALSFTACFPEHVARTLQLAHYSLRGPALDTIYRTLVPILSTVSGIALKIPVLYVSPACLALVQLCIYRCLSQRVLAHQE